VTTLKLIDGNPNDGLIIKSQTSVNLPVPFQAAFNKNKLDDIIKEYAESVCWSNRKSGSKIGTCIQPQYAFQSEDHQQCADSEFVNWAFSHSLLGRNSIEVVFEHVNVDVQFSFEYSQEIIVH
jgi:hypothetical protein